LKKSIFGYNVHFINETENLSIESFINLYPSENIDNKKKVELIISNQVYPCEVILRNPQKFNLHKKGFSFFLSEGLKIHWDLSKIEEDKITIYLYINEKKGKLISFIKKFLSKSYESLYDSLGCFLHELVLVPLTFLFQDKVIVHGCSFYNIKAQKSIIIGGTGGVGKTSISLEIGRNKDWVFLSDDMTVIDATGKIYPNYAFPKFFGYNTLTDKAVEKKVLSEFGILNKIHWNIMKKIRPSNVMRSFSPDKWFFVQSMNPELDYFCLLLRGNFPKQVDIQLLELMKCVFSNETNIFSEYYAFLNIIRWYEYNIIHTKEEAIITVKKIIKNYQKIYKNIFSKSNNFSLNVSNDAESSYFQKKITSILSELIQ